MDDPLHGSFILTLVVNAIVVPVLLLKTFLSRGAGVFIRWVLLPALGALAFSLASVMMADGIVAQIVSLVLMLTYAVGYMILARQRAA